MSRFVPCCVVLAGLANLAAALPATTLIQRPSVAQFADPACMVKQREVKTAQLGDIQETARGGGCVGFKGSDGKVFYVMESMLSARGPADVCKVKPGSGPVAKDMAGTSAGGGKVCP